MSIGSSVLPSLARKTFSTRLSALQFAGGEQKFLSTEDLIPPSQLKNLKPNDDYVLLTHQPNESQIDSIQMDGLRSTKDLALDPAASQEIKERYAYRSQATPFGNDPSLIYFRPVTPNSIHQIMEKDIVIAAKPDKTTVFDQEHRARDDGSSASYKSSGLPINEYENLMAQKPFGTVLNRYKTFTPWAYHRSDLDYIPEVAVKADRIKPEMFVPHDKNGKISYMA